MSLSSISPKVKCRICEEKGLPPTKYHFLEEHLNDAHSQSLHDYLDKFGEDTPIASNVVWEAFNMKAPERKGTNRYDNIVKVGGIQLERNQGEVKDRFNRPFQYSYPKQGDAALSAERFARALKYKRKSMFIYGPAGSGKSAVVRALTHDLNMEASHYPMREGLDPELYLGKEAVVIDEDTGNNITKFIKGKLLKDIAGRVGKDGVRRGVVILIDDIDRAPAEYHEVLRHVLEDNSQNVFIPELGINVDVHPDTRIVATANSAGRGDMTGYYSSVQEMDESILDRFQRVIQFHFLEPEEEEAILKKKFPELAQEIPREFERVMQVTSSIREMIKNNDIFASFSHRRLVQWMQSAEELYAENGNKPYADLMKDAAKDWLEWYDLTTRNAVIKRAMDIIM